MASVEPEARFCLEGEGARKTLETRSKFLVTSCHAALPTWMLRDMAHQS